jgi:hypothetical protein
MTCHRARRMCLALSEFSASLSTSHCSDQGSEKSVCMSLKVIKANAQYGLLLS